VVDNLTPVNYEEDQTGLYMEEHCVNPQILFDVVVNSEVLEEASS